LAAALLPDAGGQKQMVAPKVRQPALWRLSLRSEEERWATLTAAALGHTSWGEVKWPV